MGHVEIRFLHGPCGNQISAWAMWKSDFFSLVQMNFTIFLKMYGNFSMTIAYTNSYRNTYFSTESTEKKKEFRQCNSSHTSPTLALASPNKVRF